MREHFYTSIDGWFSYKAIYERALSLAQDGAVFVEVGAWKGRSASWMAVELERTGKDVKFFCVDTWDPPDEPWYQNDADVKAKRLFQVFLRNIAPVEHMIRPLRMTSIEAAALFDDGAVDFVFIDGTHSYEAVKADIAAWRPKVRAGGVIAGDDMQWTGVPEAVREAFGDGFQHIKNSWLAHV